MIFKIALGAVLGALITWVILRSRKWLEGLKWPKNKQKWAVIQHASIVLEETSVLQENGDIHSINDWLNDPSGEMRGIVTHLDLKKISDAIVVRKCLADTLQKLISQVENPCKLHKYDRGDVLTNDLVDKIIKLGKLTDKDFIKYKLVGSSSIIANRYFSNIN